MNKYLVLIAVIFCPLTVQAGEIDTIAVLYELYGNRSAQQIQIYRQGYQYMLLNNDSRYKDIYPRLVKYTEKHPDEYVEIRLESIKLFTNVVHDKIPFNSQIQNHIEHLIHRALTTGDKILLSQVYRVVGYSYNTWKNYAQSVFYYMKAMECAASDPDKFIDWDDIRFNLALNTYHIFEYRKSINLTLASIRESAANYEEADLRTSFYKNDLLSAAYRAINMPDSALYYCQILKKGLNTKIFPNKKQFELWRVMIDAQIAFLSLNVQNSEDAMPTFQTYREVSLNYPDSVNYLTAFYYLGVGYRNLGNKQKAYNHWKKALNDPAIKRHLQLRAKITKAMFEAAYQDAMPDSAIHYLKLHHEVEKSIMNYITLSGFDVIKSSIKLEQMNERVQSSQTLVKKIKTNRNLSLIITLLTGCFIFLIVQRRQQTLKNRLQQAQFAETLRMQEFDSAREQVSTLTKNLIEKTRLNISLTSQIKEGATPESLIYNVNNFTILTDQQWVDFRDKFVKSFPMFLHTLTHMYPNITNAEQRLAALIFLHFNNEQIAAILGISRSSVNKARYRLKQSLHLEKNETIEAFLKNIR